MREFAWMRRLTVLGLVLLSGIGCSPPEAGIVEPSPPVEEFDAAVEVMEKDGLRLTPLTGSPQFPDARLAIEGLEGPLPSGSVPFDFTVEGYELGIQTGGADTNGLANSAKGQHIHLIVDNGPYSAHYEPRFDKELGDGSHVVLAFLSRSYHESVKAPGAFVLRQVTVGDGEEEPLDLAGQHLFYSRPKGVYSGTDAERLMLDFYLVNSVLSADGNRVRATINGTEFLLPEWQPYVIEGLPMGEVEIQLELVDAAGEPVPGPFNRVVRTVTLEASPAEEG